MSTLWRLYALGYGLGLRNCRTRAGVRLLLEPCTYWRNVEIPAAVEAVEGRRILDVGSPKLPSLYLARRGAEVWATDLFPYFMDEYSRYASQLGIAHRYRAELQDARALGYENESFDSVFTVSVVEHIEGEGDSTAVREMARVLRPGGRLCVTVPVAAEYRESFTTRQLYYKPSDGKPVFYERHYDEAALHRRLVQASGLDLNSLKLYRERFAYERLYRRLPKPLKLLLAPFGWIASAAFITRAPDFLQAATAVLTLQKPK